MTQWRCSVSNVRVLMYVYTHSTRMYSHNVQTYTVACMCDIFTLPIFIYIYIHMFVYMHIYYTLYVHSKYIRIFPLAVYWCSIYLHSGLEICFPISRLQALSNVYQSLHPASKVFHSCVAL